MEERTLDEKLTNKRFIMTQESREIFRSLKNILMFLQQDKPWIKGLSFFGSRTIGAENPKSDIDLYVFYDGDEYKRDGWVGKMVNKCGKLVVEQQHPQSTAFPKSNILSNLESLLSNTTGRHFPIMQTKDHDDELWVGVDISKRQTDLEFADFVDKANTEQPISQSMVVRFLLSVGKEVYANRAYILDKIATLPNPDYYASTLANALQDFERLKKRNHAVPYAHFPKTVEGMRKYFLLEPQHDVSSSDVL